MEKYKYFDHTADAKFQAYGSNLEEAFENSALALIGIITDVSKVKPKIMKTITVEARNEQALLFDFLEEFIFLLDTKGFLLSQITSLKISSQEGFLLEAEVLGDNAKEHEIFTAIKAITYNEMFINKEKNLVTIQVVPDI